MEHTESNIAKDADTSAVDDAQERFERPDKRGPRGNQEVEQVDVERGEAKIERVLGW